MDLQKFLTLYPWQEEHLTGGEPMHWLWTYDFASTPEEMWPGVIETSKINREVGFGEARYEDRGGVLHGRMIAGKHAIEWVEIPWSWNYARSLGNVRLYSSGLMRAQRIHLHYGDRQPDGKQRAYVYMGCIPSKPEYARMLQPYFDTKEVGYGKALMQIDAAVQERKSKEYAFTPQAIELTDDALTRIAELRGELIELNQPADLVDRLVEYIASGDELDLYRIRLVDLAQKWGIATDPLLSVALHAVRAGMLTLSWDVICPHCRNMRHELASLVRVNAQQGRCDACGIDFSTSDENALEITFHVHPSLAEVPRRYYCLGEASSKPHIKVQYRLLPGQEIPLCTALPPGRYRLRMLGSTATSPFDITEGASTDKLYWQAGTLPDAQSAAPQPCFILNNPTDHTQVFVIEEPTWEQNVLRPAALFNHQDFRDLFSQEALASDLYLDIGVQTIMFTDIVGSTRLYSGAGDARAFLAMKHHFETIASIARQYRGAIVKTIGDGAMLAFPTPAQGLAAAVEIQRTFAAQADGLQARVSLHTGRCLAVNLNTGIDYFGQTVNLAAKLQLLARQGGIAISQEMAESGDVQAVLQREHLSTEAAILEHATLPEAINAFHVEMEAVKA
jgi:class 3 adenylate cyclase